MSFLGRDDRKLNREIRNNYRHSKQEDPNKTYVKIEEMDTTNKVKYTPKNKD